MVLSSRAQQTNDISPQGVLATVTGIDAKTVATTTLYTPSRTAIITGLIIRPTTTSVVTTGPILGVGVAAGEVDIVAALDLTTLVAAGKVAFGTPISINAVSVAAASVIKLGITTGAVATTYTISVDLLGYLV